MLKDAAFYCRSLSVGTGLGRVPLVLSSQSLKLPTTMGRAKSRREMGRGFKHSASSLGDSASHNNYHVLLRMLCSIIVHPLGFLLVDFLHPRKSKDDLLLALPPELVDGLEPTLTKEAYERRASLQQTIKTTVFETSLTDWCVSGGNQENLVKSLSHSMNEVWNDAALYANPRRLLCPRDEKGTARSPISNILVQRKIGREKADRDPAALLIEVGASQRHSLAITYKAICSTLALVKKGLLREPMLMVAIHTLAHHSAQDFPGAQLVVLLVIPRKNKDFRMALLWRGTLGTARAMASDLARIIHITEYVAEWNRLKPNMDYECLGPHCCRIGEKVRLLCRAFLLSQQAHQAVLRFVCQRCSGAKTTGFDLQSAARTCTY
jgi:hypothetical protein